ncbi:TrmH family RNA methyltransferase [Nocardioides sp. CFH 31398]|uniref:TrmH family RNA methyltransferase n=1 Tax=Nocardioides sp. CFH 31398 TaxID=2919579 RepID=UPI001F05198C|nr:TrmH family RNA methyltransferase [Nocardioides sp. CFH 31398]MCH1865602.1 rRNA methyltransferase [Nocardioides sp. CFH 31398]
MSAPAPARGGVRVVARDARFQQWQALLGSRRKRHRAGAMLVGGVRPVSLALEHGWKVRELLLTEERALSRWAYAVLDDPAVAAAPVHAVTPDLMAELGEKDEDVPELLAVVGLPDDDLDRVPVTGDDGEALLVVVLDRPTSPGNLGSVVRSADALGAHAVLVVGHAADPYDPRAVRSSTGSMFALPVVRVGPPADVLAWVERLRAGGTPVALVATDEDGDAPLDAVDLTGPTLLLAGNETRGLSTAWREAADVTASIPMRGAASSLNVAAATTVVLYEASRQRGGSGAASASASRAR